MFSSIKEGLVSENDMETNRTKPRHSPLLESFTETFLFPHFYSYCETSLKTELKVS